MFHDYWNNLKFLQSSRKVTIKVFSCQNRSFELISPDIQGISPNMTVSD